MKIIKEYPDLKRRLVFKHSFMYGWQFALQEKARFGWKTLTTQYPHIMKGRSLKSLEEQLEFQLGRTTHDDKRIGNEMVKKFNNE